MNDSNFIPPTQREVTPVTSSVESTVSEKSFSSDSSQATTIIEDGLARGNETFPESALQSFGEWKIIQSFPARGSEADIFLAEKDGERRILKLYRFGIQPKEEVLQRIARISRDHPGKFVQILMQGHDEVTQRFFELQEYFSLGTLKNCLEKDKLTQDEIIGAVSRLNSTLATLHECGILHLDLKPANILLRRRNPLELVVTDFGIASLLEEDDSKKLTEVKGTSLYQSPESLSGVVGPKSDWWALGMIILEILGEEHPFDGLQRQVIFFHLTTKGVPIKKSIQGRWLSLIRGLLTRNPYLRWGHQELDKWLNGEDVPDHFEEKCEVSPASLEAAAPAHPEWWDRLPIPKIFQGKTFETLESLLEWFIGSPEAWETGKCFLSYGGLVKWLRNCRDHDRAERISRLLGEGETSDTTFFKLVFEFRPDLPLSWGGEHVTREFLIKILNKAVKNRLVLGEQIFLEHFFSGWLQQTIEKNSGRLPDDVEKFFARAQSLKDPPMGGLPLSKQAGIMLTVVRGDFDKYHPFEAAKQYVLNPNTDTNLLRLSSLTGFVEWAVAENIIKLDDEFLWRVTLPLGRDRLKESAPLLIQSLENHESELIDLLAAKKGGKDDFIRFLMDGEINPDSLKYFIDSQKANPLVGEFFRAFFRLGFGADIECLLKRFYLYVLLRKNETRLREKILPPILHSVMEKGPKTSSSSLILREFLGNHKLEILEDLITYPETLPDKGFNGISSWGDVEKVLINAKHAVPKELNAKNIQQMYARLRESGFRKGGTSQDKTFFNSSATKVAAAVLFVGLICLLSGVLPYIGTTLMIAAVILIIIRITVF